ncbi:MAG: hypothetical protein PHR28_04945 [candidate division Zixibacteria bacterium]|jgi:hypothetical protein|nr:hypothetical protein [candidate division Zixibacteria bacterium]
MSDQIAISFGGMADPIAVQIGRLGYTLNEADATRIQKLSDAITLLLIHGMIPDREGHAARKRLMNYITKCISSRNDKV